MVCVLTVEDPPPKGRGREAGGGACSAVNRRMTGWMNWPSGWMDDCTDLREASLFGFTTLPLDPRLFRGHCPSDLKTQNQ
jgi:hypothetical protein